MVHQGPTPSPCSLLHGFRVRLAYQPPQLGQPPCVAAALSVCSSAPRRRCELLPGAFRGGMLRLAASCRALRRAIGPDLPRPGAGRVSTGSALGHNAHQRDDRSRASGGPSRPLNACSRCALRCSAAFCLCLSCSPIQLLCALGATLILFALAVHSFCRVILFELSFLVISCVFPSRTPYLHTRSLLHTCTHTLTSVQLPCSFHVCAHRYYPLRPAASSTCSSPLTPAPWPTRGEPSLHQEPSEVVFCFGLLLSSRPSLSQLAILCHFSFFPG
ncbi:hypothetical protein F4780DRAFT_197367 [Xylariomycetidae sp. FL0641]|nr:hypothetical protein F4780DRAFT_197367 [Xylariomycetidae sp. FL0641]